MHPLHDVLDLFAVLLEDGQIRTEDLHVQGALETGLRLIDGILGGLRVVERDPGKDL